ncbi:unnamed protein product [Litomosoides sigmodontis]|uniref:Uncharacterized protein n=1 Tax=Litomosoides sigmodontis TaxID=42156 RepID=A0A3P7LXS5_LITSI|nr:unnamed protein product [Litomosoides sigmodontis]
MTDNEHNLSATKIHANKIDDGDIDRSMIADGNNGDDDDGDDDDAADGDDVVVKRDANVDATRGSVKRRNYQRKRKSEAVEQISSFLNVKNRKIPTPSAFRPTPKCEYAEKEVSSFFF